VADTEFFKKRLRDINKMIDRALDRNNARQFHAYVLRRRELLIQWAKAAEDELLYDEDYED